MVASLAVPSFLPCAPLSPRYCISSVYSGTTTTSKRLQIRERVFQWEQRPMFVLFDERCVLCTHYICLEAFILRMQIDQICCKAVARDGQDTHLSFLLCNYQLIYYLWQVLLKMLNWTFLEWETGCFMKFKWPYYPNAKINRVKSS